MSRIIAIDYGLKRTGLAVTDPLQIIATHLDAIATTDLISYLKKYTASESVEGIVIGKPLTLRNELNDIAKRIASFKLIFLKEFPNLYVEELDERFTSKMATYSILQSGAKKKTRQDKGLVDMVSAVILLQNFLDLKSNRT